MIMAVILMVVMVMLVDGRVPTVTLLVMVVVTVAAVAVVVVCDTGDAGPDGDGDLAGAGGTRVVVTVMGHVSVFPTAAPGGARLTLTFPALSPTSLLSPLSALPSSTFGFQLGH